jgi:hypothetical protein
MLRSRWFQFLSSLGLEFWLPLPLLGLGFWLLSGLITKQILSRSDDSRHKISVDTTEEVLFTENKIRSIQLKIKEQQGISKVKVKLAYSALKEVELEFPKTEQAEIEVAIAKELGLTVQQVKTLLLRETKAKNDSSPSLNQ